MANTAAPYDHGVKPLYAKHGIPEGWLVDIEASLVRFFRQPQGDRHPDVAASDKPGPTPPSALPGVIVDLSGVL